MIQQRYKEYRKRKEGKVERGKGKRKRRIDNEIVIKRSL